MFLEIKGDYELEMGRTPAPIMNRKFDDQQAIHQVEGGHRIHPLPFKCSFKMCEYKYFLLLLSCTFLRCKLFSHIYMVFNLYLKLLLNKPFLFLQTKIFFLCFFPLCFGNRVMLKKTLDGNQFHCLTETIVKILHQCR